MSNVESLVEERAADLVQHTIGPASLGASFDAFVQKIRDAISQAGCTNMAVNFAPRGSAAKWFIFLGVPATSWHHAATTLWDTGAFLDGENAVFLTPLGSDGVACGASYRVAIESMIAREELSHDVLVPMRESLNCLNFQRHHQPEFVSRGTLRNPGYVDVLRELSSIIIPDVEVANTLFKSLVSHEVLVNRLASHAHINGKPVLFSEGTIGAAALKQCFGSGGRYAERHGLQYSVFDFFRANRSVANEEFEEFVQNVQPEFFNRMFYASTASSYRLDDPEYAQCVLQGLFSENNLNVESNNARRIFSQLKPEVREQALRFMLPYAAEHNSEAISEIAQTDLGGDCLVYRDTVAAIIA